MRDQTFTILALPILRGLLLPIRMIVYTTAVTPSRVLCPAIGGESAKGTPAPNSGVVENESLCSLGPSDTSFCQDLSTLSWEFADLVDFDEL